MRDVYERLVDGVTAARNWELLSMLQESDQSLTQASAILETVFMNAVQQHDDEAAYRLFRWLMKAVEDSFLIPLLDKGVGGKLVLPITLNSKSEEMRQVAKAKTERAMRLYPALPEFKEDTIYLREGHGESSGQKEEIKILTLLGTKKELLGVIARWWRDTEDEEEADQLFEFLRTIPRRFKEESEMLGEVIREATNSSFPVARLGRHIVSQESWGTHPHRGKDINGILALAWARNQDEEGMAMGARVLLPLHVRAAERATAEGVMTPARPEAAFALLVELSSQVAELDVQGEELKKKLEEASNSHIQGEGFGRIEVHYPDLTNIKVQFFIRCRPHLAEKVANNFRARFAKARDIILEWKGERGVCFPVSLQLFTYYECQREQAPPFREEVLH